MLAGLVAAACNGAPEDDNGAVSLLHNITGDDEQAALQAAVDAFEEATGNQVAVEASPDFATVVLTRVQGGNPPDVALYPQPGLLERLSGDAVPLADAGVDVDGLQGELLPGMFDAGTFDGTAYGVIVKASNKSLLWYSPAALEEAGYQVPDAWEELVELTDTIANDLADEPGRAPWCIGIESAEATGWVATDWVEDIMLRLHGPDVYDQWIAGEVAFDSPEVREAFQELEDIWFNPDYVLGGTTAILQTPFLDAPAPLFTDPPGCYLHRQAGFISGEFPEDAELGTGYDVAYLPPMADGAGSGVLGGGDLAAIHTDNPVAVEFVEFLLSTEGQEAWHGHPGSGSLSVRADFDAAAYPAEELGVLGDILGAADFSGFDASDAMPSQVGAGAFWTEMVAWISGAQDLDTTLGNIDAAWPEDE